MTFCCKNYIETGQQCGKLGGECVPGRGGCVLDGEFRLSDTLAERAEQAGTAPAGRRSKETP